MSFLLKEVFTGLPKTVGTKAAKSPMEREWTSGIFKEKVEGAVWLSKTKLEGDGQADLENHGGLEKAVFAYPLEHYRYWQQEHGISDISSGGMGENFIIDQINEGMISIGDTFQIGEAIVQVSQPRQPCWKPARRFRTKNLALLIQNTGRTGWYFRVLKEGHVEAGQPLILVENPYPQWTIEKCNEVLHAKKANFEEMRELAACDCLAPKLRDTLHKRMETQEAPNIQKRVYGPNE
jgi:MOSC domain-containing protein YiiM